MSSCVDYCLRVRRRDPSAIDVRILYSRNTTLFRTRASRCRNRARVAELFQVPRRRGRRAHLLMLIELNSLLLSPSPSPLLCSALLSAVPTVLRSIRGRSARGARDLPVANHFDGGAHCPRGRRRSEGPQGPREGVVSRSKSHFLFLCLCLSFLVTLVRLVLRERTFLVRVYYG